MTWRNLKMSTPEGKLQEKVKKYVESRGGIVYKNQATMYSSAGFPDMTVIYKGVFLGLEHKVKGNYPSEIQKAWNKKINDAGGISIVDYSVEDVERAMHFIDRRMRELKVINPHHHFKYEGKTK